MNISISQALSIYQDLIDAKNGKASHGNIAEIYVYKLMPSNPMYASNWANPPQSFLADYIEDELNALNSLLSIISEFLKYNKDCEIKINDMPLKVAKLHYENANERFSHRIHLSVYNKA